MTHLAGSRSLNAKRDQSEMWRGAEGHPPGVWRCVAGSRSFSCIPTMVTLQRRCKSPSKRSRCPVLMMVSPGSSEKVGCLRNEEPDSDGGQPQICGDGIGCLEGNLDSDDSNLRIFGEGWLLEESTAKLETSGWTRKPCLEFQNPLCVPSGCWNITSSCKKHGKAGGLEGGTTYRNVMTCGALYFWVITSLALANVNPQLKETDAGWRYV